MNPPPARRIHPATVWVPVILIALGVVILYNYLIKVSMEEKTARLPMLSRLERNLVATERSGKQVELKDLKGKVIAASWVYTHCPRGCPGVIAEMNKAFKDIQQRAGANADKIQFLSFSVDPEDKPQDLKEFTDRFKIETNQWWFLTGPKEVIRPYMTKFFGFYDVVDIPEKERLSPDDKFTHDMRVALVDSSGNVRGFYDLAALDPDARALFQKKFRDDAVKLLSEKELVGRTTGGLVAYLVVVIGSCGYLVWQRFRNPPQVAVAPA